MKKKLLSPLQLKEFRLQQEEQKKLRAAQLEQKKLEEEKKSRRVISPKELLDPKPVVENKELPVVEPPKPKEPIQILEERLEEVASTIKEPKYYDEEISRLEVLLSNKVELNDINLEPLNNKINELREYISELPEVKYYDEDLDKLVERVDNLQISGSEIFQQHGENLKEIKKVIHQMLEDLDKLSSQKIPEEFDPTDIQNDIVATKEIFYERVAELKKEISELPAVKYYDNELTELQERIEDVRSSIPEVPEVRYYDEDLDNLLIQINEVRNNIQELPEVKYYENEISQLDEAIQKVETAISELPEVKYYDKDISSLKKQIRIVEGKIPEVKYYDEDISNLEESLKLIENKIPEDRINDINALNKSLNVIKEAVVTIRSSLRNVTETVDNIPENVDWSHEIDYLYEQIEKLKEKPVNIKEDADPLLPLDQKFVTFDDLAQHYRTFINRIQQQLTSLGGGGEVNLRYLDDIDRTSIANGRVLSYNSTTKKFVFISPGAASSLWNETVEGNLYKIANIGIGTDDPQVALDVVGDVNITGVVTAASFTGEFISNVDKNLEYYTSGISSGSLYRITTSEGTKTFQYNNVGTLTTIIGTGSYPSKEFSYDGNGNLIFVNVL